MLTTRLVLALLIAAVVAAQDVQDHSELNIANDVFDSDIDAGPTREGPPPGISRAEQRGPMERGPMERGPMERGPMERGPMERARRRRAGARRRRRASARRRRRASAACPAANKLGNACVSDELMETAKKWIGRTMKMEMQHGHPCWIIYEGCGFSRCLVPHDMPPVQLWCDKLKGDTSKIDVPQAKDMCAGWKKSEACDKIKTVQAGVGCTGSKGCGGGKCWDKKTVGTVCCPCSVPNPKEYVERKLKEMMGVAMTTKGIEDLDLDVDVGASTKNINYLLKIEAASNAMSACQKKKCAASGGSLNALSLNMTGGVAESDAGLGEGLDALLDVEDADEQTAGWDCG